MSVCRIRHPRICFVFANCFALMCAFAFFFSGLSGVGCWCCWMCALCLVPTAVAVVGVAVVDSFSCRTNRFHFGLSRASCSIADQLPFIDASMQRGEL